MHNGSDSNTAGATGKTIVITGASDGIGASAARILQQAGPGNRLVVVGRDEAKTLAVPGYKHLTADFTSLAQVRELAEELRGIGGIDVLANNAGGMFDGPVITEDGWERNWQVNTVAPFLLTSLLRPQLRGAVVNTSSMASHLMGRFDPGELDSRTNFDSQRAYGNAKVGVNLMTRYFHLHGIPSVAFHPGVIDSSFGSRSTGLLSKAYATRFAHSVMASPDKGGLVLAQFIAGQPGIHWDSGYYYGKPGRKGFTRRGARGDRLARRVFDEVASRVNVEWGL